MANQSSAAALGLAALLALAPARAEAFCGFYVGGADAKLFNNATMVVMMREGTRTVLSMQNNYQGPPENFAMVVPVPVILQKENVKTLTPAIFDRVDQLAAPRLVEYWEQDPCPAPSLKKGEGIGLGSIGTIGHGSGAGAAADPKAVRVEAQFAVGEYEIVILSADDAGALDAWIRKNGYHIPEGAEAALRPYVQNGWKFFVAKVDVTKVKMEKGQAMLSPLRFHYDAEQFNLPVRLGLLNANGAQDLIVHILARGQRFEAANFDNVAVPTNLDVSEKTQQSFGSMYAKLFDRTLEKNPKAIVTEYAWQATSCDPCPTRPLTVRELATLGSDVMPSQDGGLGAAGFVVTRLHARYGKESLGEDIVFRAAPAIVGGREHLVKDGKLEEGALPAGHGGNNFQARYAVRHPWKGAIRCAHPQRGIWGGPPDGQASSHPTAAQHLAFAKRDQPLTTFFAKDALTVAEGGGSMLGKSAPVAFLPMPVLPAVSAAPSAPPVASEPPPPPPPAASAAPIPPPPPEKTGGCAGCNAGSASSTSGLLVLLVASLSRLVRRRR